MLAQTTTNGGAGGISAVWFILLYVVFALPMWAVFKKAGSDMAWGAFVPILNLYVLLKIVGRPGWWLLLFLIPIVNVIILIVVYYDLSKSFGHGGGFTVGLIILSWIFLAILGWGSSRYQGPAAGGPGMAPPPPPPAS
jgi:Family of unknown function (DUF5684)